MTTYISLVAQHDNLGDLVIRQLSLDWASDLGEPVRALVNGSADDYVDSLVVPANASLSSSRALWYVALLRDSLLGRRPNLVYAAGPQKIRWNRETWLNGLLGVIAHFWLFVGRGKVAKIGRSLGDDSVVGGLLEAQLIRQSDYYSVRDSSSALTSASRFRNPRIAPDIAFSYNYPQPIAASRDLISFALRSADGINVEVIQDLVRRYSLEGFRCQVVVQVRSDSGLAESISAECGIPLVPWPRQTAPAGQLSRVLSAYSDSAAVVTNRLHAAVFAAGMGALPIAYEPSTTSKVSRTLATAGVDFHQVSDFRPNNAITASTTKAVHSQVESARHKLRVEKDMFVTAMKAPLRR